MSARHTSLLPRRIKILFVLKILVLDRCWNALKHSRRISSRQNLSKKKSFLYHWNAPKYAKYRHRLNHWGNWIIQKCVFWFYNSKSILVEWFWFGLVRNHYCDAVSKTDNTKDHLSLRVIDFKENWMDSCENGDWYFWCSQLNLLNQIPLFVCRKSVTIYYMMAFSLTLSRLSYNIIEQLTLIYQL